MKANELMIGDFVTFKDCQNDKEIIVIKIWHLSQEGNALVFIDDSKVLYEIAIDDEIVGIHLTSEILEKNGFTKGCGVWVIYRHPSIKWFVLYKKEFSYTISVGESEVSINYVHELQHILKLCGIEKNIII